MRPWRKGFSNRAAAAAALPARPSSRRASSRGLRGAPRPALPRGGPASARAAPGRPAGRAAGWLLPQWLPLVTLCAGGGAGDLHAASVRRGRIAAAQQPSPAPGQRARPREEREGGEGGDRAGGGYPRGFLASLPSHCDCSSSSQYRAKSPFPLPFLCSLFGSLCNNHPLKRLGSSLRKMDHHPQTHLRPQIPLVVGIKFLPSRILKYCPPPSYMYLFLFPQVLCCLKRIPAVSIQTLKTVIAVMFSGQLAGSPALL